ncbi:ParB N-terminal domain-containing protein [Verrucosispora sp. WMMD573]|uniref:ParB N-terminal domain-containing protein n=1 Tax=Verrucosispora sp. WMMD573 TaxID=3015149 RepID=UPI00248D20EB|nr:ParB N-terminal domain-containing protein [Verrucosispora sp. WMMD573]WBB53247.1 ParB N-terminal domain-containing protein [Verrucosispora sp. WMMD573]
MKRQPDSGQVAEVDNTYSEAADTIPQIEMVDVSSLRGGFSPRLDGISASHTRLLGELTDAVPPIVVQRSSLRVVDGMHRLRAARARGDRRVPVVYFDGSDADAFVAAVQLNIAHGLPLSTRDRLTAAERILASHSQWSDRRIASVCGVAAKTVAALRRRSTDNSHQLNVRIGRDGRRRPVSAEAGRRLAEQIVRREPGVSLREIARRAGISVGTAFDVRRKALGEAPALAVEVTAAETAPEPPASASTDRLPATAADLKAVIRPRLERLVQDPSLRYTDHGKALLRLLTATLTFIAQSADAAGTVPAHCHEPLRAVAQACAGGWHQFSEMLAE